MDLFDAHRRQRLDAEAPLADRMRPRTLDDFIGQGAVMGPGAMLRRAIAQDRLQSLILYGPPGTGKTSLARLLANETDAHFASLNAAEAGVKQVREQIEAASRRLGMHGQRTVLFLDEIHRFNKAQQDALLPAVEDGTIILVGATTENPLLTVNSPLVSRARLIRFEPLSENDLGTILQRALDDDERGLGARNVELTAEARRHLINRADGDARELLNALELAAFTVEAAEDGRRVITLEDAEEAIQQRAVRYDRDGDAHYDTISAFIKSMRGSDPDATLFWLARMLVGGEDPRFIARRLLVHAAEDVGLADPRALLVASAAARSVEWVGMPECRIPLAEAALYIAMAPKSNAVITGIDAAMAAVQEEPAVQVPPHLRDSHYAGAGRLGHGEGYRYPHDYPDAQVPQTYLPEGLDDATFYHPSPRGWEGRLKERLQQRRQAMRQRAEGADQDGNPGEPSPDSQNASG